MSFNYFHLLEIGVWTFFFFLINKFQILIWNVNLFFFFYLFSCLISLFPKGCTLPANLMTLKGAGALFWKGVSAGSGANAAVQNIKQCWCSGMYDHQQDHILVTYDVWRGKCAHGFCFVCRNHIYVHTYVWNSGNSQRIFVVVTQLPSQRSWDAVSLTTTT